LRSSSPSESEFLNYIDHHKPKRRERHGANSRRNTTSGGMLGYVEEWYEIEGEK
jgi:hypothetical protein